MDELKIACVGDIMCGDSFYDVGHGVASGLSKYGRDFLRAEIIVFLCGHDVVLGNVECALSDEGRKNHVLRTVHMRGRPIASRYLAGWGVTITNVANNHILEHGYAAAIDTVRNLQESGVRTIGAGKNRLFQRGLQVEEISCGGRVLAFIGLCLCREKYAFNGGAESSEILEQLQMLTRQDKIVCISVHWGDEFMDRPSIRQKEMAHAFVEAGAKLVIGHHPHVVQGVETYKGGLIAYSLGNFIFDSIVDDCCWSVILSLTLRGQEVVRWRCLPIESDGDFRPVMARGYRIGELEREIARRSELLQNDKARDKYQEKYEVDFKLRSARARHQLRQKLYKKSWQIRPIYWPQVLFRPIQRRLGLW